MADSENSAILRGVADEAARVFRHEYQTTGYINTGDSFTRIRAEGNTVQAPISVHTLSFGRKPSEKYPPWGYVNGTNTPTPLMQWVMMKLGKTERAARGVSFLVARKLRNFGNRVHRGTVPPVPTRGAVDAAAAKVRQTAENEVRKKIDSYGFAR